MSATQIRAKIVFSKAVLLDGKAYCAGYASTSAAPTSVSAIYQSPYVLSFLQGAPSATVVVSGLSALQSYTIHCALTTIEGSATELDGVIATASDPVYTLCCKSLTFTATSSLIYNTESMYTSGYLSSVTFSYSLSSLPSSTVTVTPVLYDSSTNAPLSSTSYSISPASRTWTSSSVLLPSSFAVLIRNESLLGYASVALVPSGPSMAEYTNATFRGLQIARYSVSTIPAPVISQVIFSDSGLYLFVVFNTATNEGGLGEIESWDCSRFFSVSTSISESTCIWRNTTTVRINLSSTSTVMPGDTLTLFDNKLTASCASLFDPADCPLLTNNTAQTVSILAARTPAVPVPIVTVSGNVNPCSSFRIDPTLSTGNAGREWTSVSWNVTSTSGSAVNSVEFLRDLLVEQSGFSTSATVVIPRGSMTFATYIVSLTLTNYLGTTRTRTISFFYGGAITTPSVSILGSNNVDIYPSNALSLAATASISSCIIDSTLNFTWSIQRVDKKASAVSYSARNPRVLTLSAYSLSPGISYTVRVLATATPAGSSSFLPSSASSVVTVNVLQGSVVAVIAGGSVGFISRDHSLDCSDSYDENVHPDSQRLSYHWLCTISSLASFGSECEYIFSNSSSGIVSQELNSTSITVFYARMNSSMAYAVNVVVSASVGRFGSAKVTLRSLEPQVITASANVSTGVSQNTVNQDMFITLTANVKADVATPLFVEWTAFSSSLSTELSLASALTATSINVTSSLALSGIVFQLRIYAGGFSTGSATTFALSVYSNHDRSIMLNFNSVDVTVNGPPTVGKVICDPTSGYSFSTLFVIVNSGWDADSASADVYPLSFDFRYQVPPSTTWLFIQSPSYLASAETELPAGQGVFDYNVTISVRAYDVFNANSSASTTVSVLLSDDVDVVTSTYAALQRALNTSDNDAAIFTANSIASQYSTVNCSAAPSSYCASLNRTTCSTVPNTCGSCLDGFVGIFGASNTRCVPSTDYNRTILGDIGSACSVDDDCLYGLCSNVTVGNFTELLCTVPSKVCASEVVGTECSGHGTCVYVIGSSLLNYAADNLVSSEECTIFNTNCYPTCQCSDGYGGLHCSLSPDGIAQQVSLMDSVCSTLTTVVNQSTPSARLLDSIASTLLVASAGLQGLNKSASCQSALSVVASLATADYLADATYDSTANLLGAVSNFVVAGASDYIDDSLSQIVQGLLGYLVNGQEALSYSSDNLQISLHKDLVSSFETSSLAFPRTEEEIVYNVTAPTIEFVNGAGLYCGNQDGFVNMAVTKWTQNPFTAPNDTQVTSLLRTESYPFPNVDYYPTVNYSIVMYYYSIPFLVTQALPVYTLEERLFNPDLNNTIPGCFVYNIETAEYEDCNACRLSHYDNSSVTYACFDIQEVCGNPRYLPPVYVNASDNSSSITARRRQLLSLSGDDDGGQLATPNVNIKQVTALLVDSGEVLVLLLSTNPFDININEAKPVLAFVAAVFTIFAVGAILFHRWDRMDYYLFTYSSYGSDGTRSIANKNKYRSSMQRQKTIGAHLATLYRDIIDRTVVVANSALRLAEHTERDLMSLVGYNHGEPIVLGRQLRKKPPRAMLSDRDKAIQEVKTLLNDAIPMTARLWKVQGFVGIIHMILRNLEMTSMFHRRSLADNRLVRWMRFMSKLSLLLFLDTLFFGIFFANAGTCETYESEDDCLATINTASGLPTCQWDGTNGITALDDTSVDPQQDSTSYYTLVRSCTLRSPPGTLTFTLVLATLSLIFSLPLEIFLDYILVTICALRPNWAAYPALYNMLEQNSPFMAQSKHLNVLKLMQQQQYESTAAMGMTMDSDPFFSRKASSTKSISKWRSSKRKTKVPTSAPAVQPDTASLMLKEQVQSGLLMSYFDHLDADCEAAILLKKLRQFIDSYLQAQLSANVTGDASRANHFDGTNLQQTLELRAIERSFGLRIDGSATPLTLADFLLHGNYHNKLVRMLQVAKGNGRMVEETVADVVPSDFREVDHDRNVALLRFFVIEHFSSFKRYVLEQRLFPLQTASPKLVDPILWLVSWFFVLSLTCFFIFWIFLWGVTTGQHSFRSWGINFVLVFVQEVILSEIVLIMIMQFVAMYAVEPQLLSIYRTLFKKFIDQIDAEQTFVDQSRGYRHVSSRLSSNDPNSLLPDKQALSHIEHSYKPFYLIQHISGACRAARSSTLYSLSTAKLLRGLTGADLEMCRLLGHKPLHLVVLYFVALPVIIGFLGREVAAMVLSATLPTSMYMFLLVNYYLVQVSAIAIVLLYLGFLMIYWYKYRIAKPAMQRIHALKQRQEQHHQSKLDRHEYEQLRTNKQHHMLPLTYSQRLYRMIAQLESLFFLIPVKVYMGAIERAYEQKALAARWNAINLPTPLQAYVNRPDEDDDTILASFDEGIDDAVGNVSRMLPSSNRYQSVLLSHTNAINTAPNRSQARTMPVQTSSNHQGSHLIHFQMHNQHSLRLSVSHEEADSLCQPHFPRQVQTLRVSRWNETLITRQQQRDEKRRQRRRARAQRRAERELRRQERHRMLLVSQSGERSIGKGSIKSPKLLWKLASLSVKQHAKADVGIAQSSVATTLDNDPYLLPDAVVNDRSSKFSLSDPSNLLDPTTTSFDLSDNRRVDDSPHLPDKDRRGTTTLSSSDPVRLPSTREPTSNAGQNSYANEGSLATSISAETQIAQDQSDSPLPAVALQQSIAPPTRTTVRTQDSLRRSMLQSEHRALLSTVEKRVISWQEQLQERLGLRSAFHLKSPQKQRKAKTRVNGNTVRAQGHGNDNSIDEDTDQDDEEKESDDEEKTDDSTSEDTHHRTPEVFSPESHHPALRSDFESVHQANIHREIYLFFEDKSGVQSSFHSNVFSQRGARYQLLHEGLPSLSRAAERILDNASVILDQDRVHRVTPKNMRIDIGDHGMSGSSWKQDEVSVDDALRLAALILAIYRPIIAPSGSQADIDRTNVQRRQWPVSLWTEILTTYRRDLLLLSPIERFPKETTMHVQPQVLLRQHQSVSLASIEAWLIAHADDIDRTLRLSSLLG